MPIPGSSLFCNDVEISQSSTDFQAMNKRIWVAITAHKPLERLSPLLHVISQYELFPFDVKVCVYIDYESQDAVDILYNFFGIFKKIEVEVKVASPGYENWYLTWAHKTDLALEILNKRADYYIYQENDMVLKLDNFKYWLTWQPRLAQRGLEPGFIRYEQYSDLKVPFDNHYVYSLTKTTPNVWGSVGFTVPKILVIDHEIDLFVQVANPYYGAMILTQSDGDKYIRSGSYDPEVSYSRVGIRNWPIADRSSMGLAFENVPDGYEHRRCIPLRKVDGRYEPLDNCLIKHDDFKYSPDLRQKNIDLLDCKQMFSLN